MAKMIWEVTDNHNGSLTVEANTRLGALDSYFQWINGMTVIYDGYTEVTDPALRRAYFDKYYLPDLKVTKIGRA